MVGSATPDHRSRPGGTAYLGYLSLALRRHRIDEETATVELLPRERDKLLLFTAALLAERRKA